MCWQAKTQSLSNATCQCAMIVTLAVQSAHIRFSNWSYWMKGTILDSLLTQIQRQFSKYTMCVVHPSSVIADSTFSHDDEDVLPSHCVPSNTPDIGLGLAVGPSFLPREGTNPRGLHVGFQQIRAELPWSPGKSFWREIQMVGFSTDKGLTALVSRKKFWREIQMVGLDIMGMMDMGCISRNLMSLKDFAVHG